mmetsp:Transcript_66283/g.144488  ORF Transcript_66283/g.144488 Transcript_66283/m.144488 type:complete len:107 (+) Transcript_66283:109-429(+)
MSGMSGMVSKECGSGMFGKCGMSGMGSMVGGVISIGIGINGTHGMCGMDSGMSGMDSLMSGMVSSECGMSGMECGVSSMVGMRGMSSGCGSERGVFGMVAYAAWAA